MSTATYPHIVSTPGLFDGEPHVEGLRIRVRDIVLARDRGSYTPEEIVATVYPDLSLAQVYSALAYYEDRRAVIEQAAAREQNAVDRFRQEHSTILTNRVV